MDYKDTINLPKTDFSMKANLVNKEPEIEKFWQDLNIYDCILKKRKDAPKYILHDGPPYANGNIHIGHALNKILKDIIVKYKNMKGFNAPYVPGWDCHGLPIEHQVTKDLKEAGLKPRSEIRKLCRDYAQKYIDIQKEEFKRLGVFGEWDNPYLTMDYEYEAGILEIFKILAEKKLIEKQLKPIYWCISCETALAEAEIEYQDHTSCSVYVKFPITQGFVDIFPEFKKKKSSMLIWTTTPWTLPANQAIAVHPDFEYAVVEYKNELLILAKSLVEQTFAKKEETNYKILKTISGSKLCGIKYSHPFMERVSPVVFANYVTAEDGAGCVHIAPGHGEEDYKVGLEHGLEVFAPVNSKGEFTEDVPLFKGEKVYKANQMIVEKLDELGVLFHKENISHSYPHCWRCKKPLIFRATEQWFINVDKYNLRENVLKSIDSVRWIPAWGQGRITGMVSGRPNWCISRQRSWGVPIPVVYCEKCDTPLLDILFIDHVIGLVKENGADIWFTKKVDDLVPNSFSCKCGHHKFRKENDILDVWFDSGVSHTSVLKQREYLDFPADLYLEGSDQHRGWFQSSIFTSVGAYNQAPYKAVLTHGFIVDGQGKKMSKSVGNVVKPQDVIKKSGADIIRLWVASSDYTEDVRASDAILSHIIDSYRKLRNTCRFILGNISDFSINKDKVCYKDLLEIDKWALARLHRLIDSVSKYYEDFQFHKVYSEISNFCVVDMSSFYLDILKDRLYTFGKKSLERRSAQTVLVAIIDAITKLMAPILCFSAEEIWEFIPEDIKTEKSIHLTDWPVVNTDYFNEKLESEWEKIKEFRVHVLKSIEEIRDKKIVGSSLEVTLLLKIADKELYAILDRYKKYLTMIFIVSEVFLEKKSFGDHEIIAGKINAPKCVRCWNLSKTVGENKDHPELCNRCLTAIKGDN